VSVDIQSIPTPAPSGSQAGHQVGRGQQEDGVRRTGAATAGNWLMLPICSKSWFTLQ